MIKWNTLYKLTSAGKIQQWDISVKSNIITRGYGQVGGKIITKTEVVKVGKNIGRSNETTPEQQALKEAEADWKKKYDKDYVLDIEEAIKQTEKIAKTGGYLPMLAQDFKKHAGRHLKYPCYLQPKLDGLRCISTKNGGVVDMWFRSGKRILTLPNLNIELAKIMEDGEIFDGELYIHNEEFNEFTGAIRANKTINEEITSRIEYHVYDVPRIDVFKEDTSFSTRFFTLLDRVEHLNIEVHNVTIVETQRVDDFKEAEVFYDKWIGDNYEGMMFRNLHMEYEQKRSYSLLKYKDMQDEEFIVTDVIIEDKFKLKQYMVVCDTGEKLVTAKMKGSQEILAKLFADPDAIIGQMATIQFFGKTPEGSLRFPIGKTIRFDK